ncbi:MAG: hypothetical protein KIT84_14125 [Labilithrix sp.]|nr:hypothetical protein [Labilithrix sp.]MCW5812158.1 hypothetical protein [Labilithrix sp.]
MRRSRLALFLVFSAGAIAFACSSFTAANDGDELPDGGPPTPGTDGTVLDVDTPPIPDGAPPDREPYDAALNPPCPAPVADSISGKTKDLLASPPTDAVEFPFQLDSDSLAVFWVAQHITLEEHRDAGIARSEAYNGKGIARIRRVRKAAPSAAETLVEGQTRTTALVLDGDHVYWAAYEGQSIIRRVRRDCAAPCEPEYVGNAGGLVHKLYRPRPGLLVLQLEGNRVHLFDLSKPNVGSIEIATTGNFTYVVPNAGDLLLGASFDEAAVRRHSGPSFSQIDPTWATLPEGGSDSEGPDALGTDCESTFAARKDQSIWRVGNDGGVFTYWLQGEVGPAVASAVDGRYVYFAALDTGGVFAFDKSTGERFVLHRGNVWNLHADAQGVYWGEHDDRSPEVGKLYVLWR